MKKVFFSVCMFCLFLLSAKMVAQEVEIQVQTIVDDQKNQPNTTESVFGKLGCGINTVGLYISPYGSFYKNDISDQFSVGGRLSLLFNNRFHWGVYSSRSTAKLKAAQDYGLFLHTKEFGGSIELTLWNRNWIHLGIPIQSGFQLYRIDSSGGSLFDFDERGRKHHGDDDDNDDESGSRALTKSNSIEDIVGVIEPGIQMEINVFRCLKLYGGVNYRLLFGNDISFQNKGATTSTIEVSKMSGLGFQLGAKLGFFEPKGHCCKRNH